MAVSQKTYIRRDARKRLILEIIRSTPEACRTLVQKRSGLSMDSTLFLINELLESDLIHSVGKSDTRKAGRKSTLLRINEEGCFFVGLRFNASSVTGAVINFDSKVVLSRDWRSDGILSAREMLAFLGKCIEELLDGLGERRSKVKGIGIGAPGIIDLNKGTILRYVHIPDWKNVDLKKTFEQRFGIPVWVEHGVKCAARAMMSMPVHSSCADMLYLQMDRGISMCIVANGQIYNGATYLSGEAGHIHVEDNGILCECGRVGCLETVATDSAILRSAQALLQEGRCAKLKSMLDTGMPFWVSTVCDAELVGDKDCAELLGNTGRCVGKVAAAALGLLNPRQLILVGWMTSSPAFQRNVRRCLADGCLDESIQACQLFFSQRDKLADARGAAELPFSKQFDSRMSVDYQFSNT